MAVKKRSDGRYASKIYLGDGKYKVVYAKTQKELRQKVADAKVALGKGIDLSAASDTFGEWSKRWLDLKSYEVSHGRLDAYKCGLAYLECFEDRPLNKLYAYDLQMLMIRLHKAEGVGIETLKNTRSAAKQVFDLAIANRVLDYNPLASVKVPQESEEPSRRALTQEEIGWILAPSEHRGKAAAMVMLFAGLRRGELMALTWDNVDLENHTITVCQTAEIVKGKSRVKQGGKTKNATRVIDIPDVLVDYLSALPRTSEYVCPSATGKLMSETAWKRMWDSYLLDLNVRFGEFDPGFKKPRSRYAPVKTPFVIPRFTAHWLRHTYITMLYQAGVDVLTAKEQAGHADISTTLSIYTHLDRSFKRREMGKLDAYIAESRK